MNTSEQYRKECEARQVLKWGREKRKEYYQGVKFNRGEAAKNELIAEVRRQYKLQEREQALEI